MSNSQLLAGVATFMAVVMTVAFLFVFHLLVAVSDTNKGQVRGLVCFDHQGQVTSGFGKECRYVAIRELGTRTRA
jgi:hypothetical protein